MTVYSCQNRSMLQVYDYVNKKKIVTEQHDKIVNLKCVHDFIIVFTQKPNDKKVFIRISRFKYINQNWKTSLIFDDPEFYLMDAIIDVDIVARYRGSLQDKEQLASPETIHMVISTENGYIKYFLLLREKEAQYSVQKKQKINVDFPVSTVRLWRFENSINLYAGLSLGYLVCFFDIGKL